MTLSFEDVEHIAELARLELTDEEKNLYRQQLSAVLEYFSRLQTVDTHHISPTFTIGSSQSNLRPDQVQPGLSRQALLSNAPDVEQGQFRVPPVLE